MIIQDIVEKLVGKPFEIECSIIKVHGMLDHHPPLFAGPGVIRASEEGKISFRMHNQITTSAEALNSLNWYRKDGEGLSQPATSEFLLMTTMVSLGRVPGRFQRQFVLEVPSQLSPAVSISSPRGFLRLSTTSRSM